MTAERPRVVFDCNVLLQSALHKEGPAASALRLFDDGHVILYVSRATLKELRAVLKYPTIREKNSQLTDISITAFLDRLMYKATMLRRVRHVFNYPRATQDEPYIDLAVAAQADFLVSRDKDLLSLMTGHSIVCKQFRQIAHPMKVVDPLTFLAAIRHGSAPPI